MSLALYRKYRPATFAEVVGQEHVTGPLMTAVDSGRINHAYLFSGPRGCGKTSSARILARSLNCETGPTSTPCGQCQSCRDLAPDGPGNIDVIEIDAASHGGVDDARDLRERAFQLPVSSRYKIYIVDEAHMVSNQGFNALLKIVEEPPESVVFIFATTEPDKVLATIRSRTHHYPFRLVPPAKMRTLLASNCESEGIAVGEAVLPLIVRAGGGSVRDSQSLLDQLIAGAGPDGIKYDDALALLGVTDSALLDDIVAAIGVADGATVFGTVDRLVDAGHDPRRFAVDLLDRLRDLILLAAVPNAGDKGLIDAPDDQLQRLGDQAAGLGLSTLSRLADIVHEGLTEMRGTTAPRLGLELICARMLLPAAAGDAAAMTQRVERIERRLEIGAPAAANRSDSRASGPETTRPHGSGAEAVRGEAAGAEAARAEVVRSRAARSDDRSEPDPPAVPIGGSEPATASSRPTHDAATSVRDAEEESAPAPDSVLPPALAEAEAPAIGAPSSTTTAPSVTHAPENKAQSARSAPVQPHAAPSAPAQSQVADDGGWPEVVQPGSGRRTPTKADAQVRAASVPAGEVAAQSANHLPEGEQAHPQAAETVRPAEPRRTEAAAPQDAVSPAPSNAGAPAEPRRTEAAAPSNAGAAAPAASVPAAEAQAPTGPTPSTVHPAAVPGFDVAEVRRQWPAVVDSIKQHSRAGAALVEQTTPVRIDGSTLVLAVPGGLVRRLSDATQQRPLQGALSEVLGVNWQISITERDAAGASDDRVAPYDPDEFGPDESEAPDDETVASTSRSVDPGEVAMNLLRNELGAKPLEDQP